MNAKLQPCPDCGHQVSKKAVACPSCGRRISFGLVIFAAVFCCALAVAFFVSFAFALFQLANMR